MGKVFRKSTFKKSCIKKVQIILRLLCRKKKELAFQASSLPGEGYEDVHTKAGSALITSREILSRPEKEKEKPRS